MEPGANNGTARRGALSIVERGIVSGGKALSSRSPNLTRLDLGRPDTESGKDCPVGRRDGVLRVYKAAALF